MNYVIPEINAGAWLLQVADLFSSVVNAILGVSILRFFMVFLLFVLIVSLFVLASKEAAK